MPEYTDDLAGKDFFFVFEDGRKWEYKFVEKMKLICTGDGEKYEAPCAVHNAPGEEGMYFVQHYCPGSKPPTAHTLVIDTNTGRVTMVIAKIGHPKCEMQVQREFLFGVIEGANISGDPHDFTDELTGMAIRWTYHEGGEVVKHMYVSPCFYSYTGVFGDGLWMATNPADYVKINDHMYIFSMIEERQTGIQGLFLINTEILMDVVSFFGTYVTGMECATAGAKGVKSTLATTTYEYELIAGESKIHKILG